MATSSRPFSIKRMPGFSLLALICFFALYMPLAPLVIYSFNAGNNIALWEGLSLRWYVAAWENERAHGPTAVRLQFMRWSISH
jgi:spermidine/putrescine transport system permease protein